MNPLRRLAASLGIGGSKSGGATPPPKGPPPYGDLATNKLYELLFCDEPALFGTVDAGPLAEVLHADTGTGALLAIGNDTAVESRVRALAFHQLRRRGAPVPNDVFLGTIVEVGLDTGLDTLAGYVDGRARYINASGKTAIFEAAPPSVADALQGLLAASVEPVAKSGPWHEKRRPPPPNGSVRLSFLVSDGLHFCEGGFAALQRDPLANPVLTRATALLQAVTKPVAAAPPA